MNKTGTIIAAFLLALTTLAGAMRLCFPSVLPAPLPETPVAASSVEVVASSPELENAPMVDVSVPEVGATDPERELRDWAMGHPREAIEWAAQQASGERRDIVLELACYEIANVNPAEAVTLAGKHALTNHAILANLTGQWAQQDLRASHAWVLAKPAGGGRNQLVARVGYVWSASEPALAAAFVVREIPPGPAQTEAAISILHQWALRNFDDAAAWVELFPDGEIRERAVNELAGVLEYSLAVVAQGSHPGESSPTQ